MRRIVTLLLLSLPLVSPARSQNDGFVPLFDGKSLQGWTVVRSSDSTFSVRDGFLHVEGNSGWLKSDQQYSDFQLRAEFRFLTDNAECPG